MSYARVSILGTTVGGEVWSINPVFDPTGEFPGWNQAAADTAASSINSILPPANLLTLLSSSMSITGCRIEVRDDVTDALIGLSEKIKTIGDAGTGTPKMGAQNALVFSVQTNTPGPSGRGRIYWPALGAGIDANLRLTAPGISFLVGDMKTYLLAIRSALAAAWPTIGFDLAVRSKATKTTPHAVRLRVGNVIDSQRRRRDHFAEAYSAVTFP